MSTGRSEEKESSLEQSWGEYKNTMASDKLPQEILRSFLKAVANASDDDLKRNNFLSKIISYKAKESKHNTTALTDVLLASSDKEFQDFFKRAKAISPKEFKTAVRELVNDKFDSALIKDNFKQASRLLDVADNDTLEQLIKSRHSIFQKIDNNKWSSTEKNSFINMLFSKFNDETMQLVFKGKEKFFENNIAPYIDIRESWFVGALNAPTCNKPLMDKIFHFIPTGKDSSDSSLKELALTYYRDCLKVAEAKGGPEFCIKPEIMGHLQQKIAEEIGPNKAYSNIGRLYWIQFENDSSTPREYLNEALTAYKQVDPIFYGKMSLADCMHAATACDAYLVTTKKDGIHYQENNLRYQIMQMEFLHEIVSKLKLKKQSSASSLDDDNSDLYIAKLTTISDKILGASTETKSDNSDDFEKRYSAALKAQKIIDEIISQCKTHQSNSPTKEEKNGAGNILKNIVLLPEVFRGDSKDVKNHLEMIKALAKQELPTMSKNKNGLVENRLVTYLHAKLDELSKLKVSSEQDLTKTHTEGAEFKLGSPPPRQS